MSEIGYALSSEEHPPNELVHYAQRAEEAGFTFALISDHFHPWIDRQGLSPFVWSVIDGLISLEPEKKIREQFAANGGSGKPSYGQLTVCWVASEKEARRIAYKWWPPAGLPGELNSELELPHHFEQVATTTRQAATVSDPGTTGPSAMQSPHEPQNDQCTPGAGHVGPHEFQDQHLAERSSCKD